MTTNFFDLFKVRKMTTKLAVIKELVIYVLFKT